VSPLLGAFTPYMELPLPGEKTWVKRLPVNSSHSQLVTPWRVDHFKIVVCDESTAGFVRADSLSGGWHW